MSIFDPKLIINETTVSGQDIANCISMYYPEKIKEVIDLKLYGYVFLFGIRVETCDTSVPDDVIGAIRYQYSLLGDDYWELLVSSASVDPSPYYFDRTIDEDARLKGGTAWVKEGKYLFSYNGDYKGEPSYKPVNPLTVYRWNEKYKGEKFDIKKAILSTSPDTLIHRSWGINKFYKDSAGCQVFKDNSKLRLLKKWTDQMTKSKLGKYFTYYLFSKEQFLTGSVKKEENNYYKFPNLNF